LVIGTRIRDGGVCPLKLRIRAPRKVNIDDNVRQAWIAAPANSAAKQALIDFVHRHIEANEVKCYKIRAKVAL